MKIIDRFEGDTAVIEDENGTFDIPRSELPEGVREGDVLIYSGGRWTADRETAEIRRNNAAERLHRLLKGGGDAGAED